MNPGIVYARSRTWPGACSRSTSAQLAGVGAFEIVLHRVAWSLAFLALTARRSAPLALARARCARQPIVLATFAASALLLAANWTIYVWAVTNGRVIDASLGYFINPLVNVRSATLVLHERPRLCAMGRGRTRGSRRGMARALGPQLPWVGLVIAVSFGLYGLMRKTARSARSKA